MGYAWLILAVLTIISGSASVKLPSIPASLSVSETFVITSVLLLRRTCRHAHRRTRRAHHLPLAESETQGIPSRSVQHVRARYIDLGLRQAVLPLRWHQTSGSGTRTARRSPALGILDFIVPLIAFTILYFLINSWLIAFAVSFETGQSAFHIWNTNLVWLSLNFFCGASVSTLFLNYIVPTDRTHFLLRRGNPTAPVGSLFTYSMSMARVADANRHLGEMNQMYLATIETLALAVDAKDQVTHGHIRRVQSYAVALTRRLAGQDPGLLHAMEAASLLHDMGKLAVPEHILNKPGKLNAAEFDRMKLHASMGADILSSIHFPYPVIPIVRHHHESWDGSGYPDGLSGTAIPLGARILAVIDCFDALTSDRPYRPRLSTEQALGILVERRGSMYDPLIVDAFVQYVTNSATKIDRADGKNEIRRYSSWHGA